MIDTRRLSKGTIKMRFNSFTKRLGDSVKKFKNSILSNPEKNNP